MQNLQDEHVEPRFGEYLVDRGVLDRSQLLRVLQLQDRVTRIRVGEAAAVLGYVHLLSVEILYEQFVRAHGHHRPQRVRSRRRGLNASHRAIRMPRPA